MDGGDDFQVWNYSTELLTSRNGVAGVVFRLSLKNSGYEARQKKKILFSKMPRMSLGCTHPPFQWKRWSFLGVKSPDRDVDRSSLRNGDVKNEFLSLSLSLSLSLCIYIYIYVCTYVCVYIYIHTHTLTHILAQYAFMASSETSCQVIIKLEFSQQIFEKKNTHTKFRKNRSS